MKGKIKYFFLRFLLGVFLPFTAFSNSEPQLAYEAFEKQLSVPDYQRAFGELEKAVRLAKETDDRPLLIKAYLAKARLLCLFQEYDQSIAINDSASYHLSNIAKKSIEYSRLEIESFILKGDALLSKGDIQEAKTYYLKADSLFSKTKVESEKLKCRLLLGQSKYFGFIKDSWNEFQYIKKAYELVDKLSARDLLRADIIIQYANAYKVYKRDSAKDPDDVYNIVRGIYRTALNEIDKITTQPCIQKANALQGLANTYADYLGIYKLKSPNEKGLIFKKAYSFYNQSLNVKKNIYGQYSSSYATTCYTIALIYQTMGNVDSALGWYDKSIASAIGPIKRKIDKENLSGLEIKDPYLLNVLLANKASFLQIVSKQTHSYQQISELYRVNIKRLQLWRRVYQTFKSKDLGKIIAEWGHAPFEEAMSVAYSLFKISGDSIYLQKIFDFAEESKNNDFIYEFAAHRKKLPDHKDATPRLIGLEDMKAVCRKTSSIYIHVTNPVIYESIAFAILVSEDKILIHPFSTELANTHINNYKSAINNSNCAAYAEASYRLYELVYKPVLSTLRRKVENMVITSGSMFQEIPIESLLMQMPTSGNFDFRKLEYLIKRYNISYALSGSIWAYQLGMTSSAGKGMVVYKPELRNKTRLLFSEKLFTQMQDKYEGDFRGAGQATRKAFLSDTNQRSIIHVFSHAKSDRHSYENSVIYFDGNPIDSVTMADIYNHRIRSQLTVLACCESGAGPENYGEGAKSLVRAFIFSGSQSVLGTIWNVDEKSTISLLKYFYSHLENSVTLPQAMRQSKLDYLSDCSSSEMANPFYWSGIIYTGDPRNQIHLSRQASTIPFFGKVLFFMAAAALIVFARRFFI